jgi:hypothetical protein
LHARSLDEIRASRPQQIGGLIAQPARKTGSQDAGLTGLSSRCVKHRKPALGVVLLAVVGAVGALLAAAALLVSLDRLDQGARIDGHC